MTTTGWKAITQAASIAKVQEEQNKEKAEHRNIMYEHRSIQIPTHPPPQKSRQLFIASEFH